MEGGGSSAKPRAKWSVTALELGHGDPMQQLCLEWQEGMPVYVCLLHWQHMSSSPEYTPRVAKIAVTATSQ